MVGDGLKLVAIGDSLTYGFPYLPDYSWVRLVADELGLRIVNKGINGDTTGGMRERFAADVLAHKPSHVLMMGGANDAFERIAVQEVTESMVHMVNTAARHGIVPVLGLTPPCDFPEEARLAKYRQSLVQYATANGITVLDFYSAMLHPDGQGIAAGLHVDGIHPNEAGYRVMAATAVDFLRKLVERFHAQEAEL